MAAPASAYLNKNINTISATGQQVANSRAIPNDLEGELKNRFYLDKLLITRDSDGDEGFTGLVYLDGDNYFHHSTSRIGSLRSFNNGVMCNYTDAGLNTTGHVTVQLDKVTQNGVLLNLTAKSAWYVITDDWGIEGAASAGYAIPAGGIQETKQFLIQGVVTGQQYDFTAYNQNVEGRYIGHSGFITIGRASITLASGSYGSTAWQNFTGGYDIGTYYLNIGSDSKIFTNEAGTLKPPAGYYADGSMWYFVNADGVISLSGSINDWNSDDPLFIPPYLEMRYLAYSSGDYTSTCSFLARPDYIHDTANDVVLWKNTIDGKLYKYTGVAVVQNTLADYGIYYTSSGSYAGMELIQNGAVVQTGNCTDGLAVS